MRKDFESDKPMEGWEIEEIQTWIEDMLDADSHSDRLPVKINFSDIEIIAELLAPQFIAKHSHSIQQAIADERKKILGEVERGMRSIIALNQQDRAYNGKEEPYTMTIVILEDVIKKCVNSLRNSDTKKEK